MNTATELTVIEESQPLQEISQTGRWQFEKVDTVRFRLGMKARDDSWFWLYVDCDRYPAVPPAWHWLNKTTGALNEQEDTPKGGGFLHGNGVVCAPWNRLAYRSENAKGPHSDWQIGNWKNNPKTGGCKTLAAMALRILHELKSPNCKGRIG